MRARLHHFTSIISVAVCLTLVLAFAPHADAATYTWDGNGDADNGGNWSDPLNWVKNSGYPSTASDVAWLPYPTVNRYVTNDVAVTIDQLALFEGTKNILVLGADLKARLVDEPGDGHPGSIIRLNGYTFSADKGNATYFPALGGDGTFVKYDTSTVILQSEDTYTGAMIVSNGVLYFRAQLWDTTTLLTVKDGGQAHLQEPGPAFPTNILINGQGYDNDGALDFNATSDECTSRIELGSNSKMKRTGASYTTTLSGDIAGTDILTLEGPGTFVFSGSSYSFSGTLWITNGTTIAAGIIPSVTNIVVQNGGTLIGTISRFPATVVGSVTSITVDVGGEWIQEAAGVWDGNGNANNGGNWSDANNWTADEVPTYQAILEVPSVNRSITNDVAASVSILELHDNTKNRLVVTAPLTIQTYEPKNSSGGYSSQVDNYSTMTISNQTSSYCFDMDKGDGTYVINGAGNTIVAQASGTFSGNFIVSNGILRIRSANAQTWSSVTVEDGAAQQVYWPGSDRAPALITISATGPSGYAMVNDVDAANQFSNLVVAADATLQNAVTMTFDDGSITGPGDLTKIGAGTMDIDNTYNFAISGAIANKMISSAGTIDISGATISVSGEAGATEDEYVIIDYSGAGTVTGEFGDTNDLAGGWEVDYDGTATYADSVVLVKAAETYAPEIQTDAATNIAETSANLNGYLSDTGGAPASVWVFYGTTDGTTNKTGADAWDTSALVSASASTGVLTYAAGSLNEDKVYFYRYYASNTTHDAWADSSQSFLPDDVTISKSSDAAEEYTVPGTFTVHRAASATNGALTVNFTVSGTATAGVHYVDDLGTSVNLAAGQSNAVIVVTPITNLTVTHDTTVTVTVATGLYLVGAPSSANLTIANYEPPEPGTNFTWTGNGDVDNGGNWSDQANWDIGDGTPGDDGYPKDPDDTAWLPYPTVDRYVTNDAVVDIEQLALYEGTRNRLVLGADMKVALVDEPGDGHPGSIIRLNGYTFSANSGSGTYFPALGGDGTFVKYGTAQVTLQSEDTFTGAMIVSNGTLKFRAQLWDTTTLLTVKDGGSAYQESTGPDLPTNILINGQGYNGAGAVYFTSTGDECASRIELGSDSKMKRTGTQTTTLTGDIVGSDKVLTLEGPGKFDLTASSYSFSGTLWVTNGTVSVPGELTSVTNIIVRNGGILVGTIAHFPATVVGSVTNITVELGGEWQQLSVGTWTGNGDADNGGNWSVGNNWSGGEVPTYQAILPDPTVDRFVTNDVASSVNILQMEENGGSTRNRLVVMAPMSIVTYDPKDNDGYYIQVDNYSTMTISNQTSLYCFDMDQGDGTYVINGAGQTIVVQASGTFSGNFIVSNGTLHVRAGNPELFSGLTVEDGCTAYQTLVSSRSVPLIPSTELAPAATARSITVPSACSTATWLLPRMPHLRTALR